MTSSPRDSEAQGATIAIVPARGGSKRVQRKNVKHFLGVPLVERTVKLLHRSGLFDEIVVSTDDDEIEKVALGAGAVVPFRRPSALADDHTPTAPVISHAIHQLEALGRAIDVVCTVYPTAVLATVDDLRRGLTTLEQTDCDYVFTVASFNYPIQRALTLTADGRCAMREPGELMTRSQDLEPMYHDAGQFYWGGRDAWYEERPVFASRSVAQVIPNYRCQDIDTGEDWIRAELLFELLDGRDVA